ncbi:MAG: DUF805 domain-containing protein [Acidaminococcaceae bacterium]|jgi:uncharacterized membrane protein YhaH (DUF805 family)|nr:DUF805 domain-containing protein [Acidaminococcaceae bacterium]
MNDSKGPMEAFKYVVTENYVNFNGRASRSEYWYYALVMFGVNLVLNFLKGALGLDMLFGTISIIVSLAVLLPGIGVAIRRLHDTGHSGWWSLLMLIPLIGTCGFLYFMIKGSDPYDNEYGPYPPRYF